MPEADIARADALPRKPLAVGLAVLALAVSVVLWAMLGFARQSDVADMAEEANAAAVNAGLPLSNVGRAEAAARVAAGPEHLRAVAAPAPPPSSLRQAFGESNDLYAYARSLAPALQAGEAEALWLMSRVVETCAGYAADPAAYARDSQLLQGMKVNADAAMRASRERVARRCGRFVASDGFSSARAGQLRREAAMAGSLVAEAELLGEGLPLAAGDDYAHDLVARVQSSLDAEAFSAISPAMGGGLSSAAMRGQPDIAPQYRELVWQLAACRLGMDCGPDSPLMTSYCVNGGICSRNPAQGFEEFAYDAAVPRQSADVVRSAVGMLVGETGE